MGFVSFHFLVFFVVVFITANFLVRGTGRKVFLLLASYYFYMLWDWRFAGLLALMSAINFIAGRQIDRAGDTGSKRLWLGFSLVSCLGILGIFKYANFFIGSVNGVLEAVGFGGELSYLKILLPVGISFYTFQAMSYCLDIYRQRMGPIDSPLDFFLFVSFFPQLVAGPIVRASHFLPQLQSDSRPDKTMVESGLFLMAVGFVKKVFFADILALHFVDAAFADPGLYSSTFLILALVAYTFQIYMDFSGYTDIARGCAKTLGFDLQINFDRPYLAATLSNFWQRWHISMSSFFRDYLFFALGGSRSGNVYLNVVLTFVAIGIWHGAGWNFVVYGALHGGVVALERYLRNRRKALDLPPIDPRGVELMVRILWVFSFVVFARVLFRAGGIDQAIDYMGHILSNSATALPVSALGLVTLCGAILLHVFPVHYRDLISDRMVRLPSPVQACVLVAACYGLVVFSQGQAPFIYFQF